MPPTLRIDDTSAGSSPICRPIGNPAEPGYTVEVQAERPHLNFLDIVPARFIITIAQEQEELY